MHAKLMYAIYEILIYMVQNSQANKRVYIGQKQYAPNPLILGHKNVTELLYPRQQFRTIDTRRYID